MRTTYLLGQTVGVINMRILRNLHAAVSTKLFRFDDFDKAILDFIASKMSGPCEAVLRSQMSLINKSQSEFDEERGEQTNCFYQMFFGESKRDFPLRLPHRDEEEVLARLKVGLAAGVVIFADVVMVDGVFFCIKYRSSSDVFRPMSPNFKIDLIEISQGVI